MAVRVLWADKTVFLTAAQRSATTAAHAAQKRDGSEQCPHSGIRLHRRLEPMPLACCSRLPVRIVEAMYPTIAPTIALFWGKEGS